MRVALVAALAIAGCGGSDPSAICHLSAKCQEFYDYTREELDVADNACALAMGSWSTSFRCSGSGTVGTCRITYTGDPAAHSLTWYLASSYSATSAMVECQNAGGAFVAAQ